jgi:hypothetical protein
MAVLQSKAYAENDLLTWTIYDHPLDFPDDYVVRPFSSRLACALSVHFKHAQLEHVRGALQNLGLTCLSRTETDPPFVLETWI